MRKTQKLRNKTWLLTFVIAAFCLAVTAVYSAEPGIDVGNKSVDFSLKELSSNKTFKLSSYENKNPVLFVFFATWCPYCIAEVSELNKLQSEYSKKGLVIVSINVQESADKVAGFVKKKKIVNKVLLDSNAEVAKKFKVYGIPTGILVDSKGVIVFRGNNLPENSDIEKVLPKNKLK